MIIKTKRIAYDHLSYEKPSLYAENFFLHCHGTYELLFFERGEANYVIDEKKYKLHKNDLVFIRPYKYHYIEFTKDVEYSRFTITFPHTLIKNGLLEMIPDELEVVNCPTESVLFGLFNRMDYYASRLSEDLFADLLSAMLVEILHELRLTDVDMAHIPSTVSPLLAKVLEYVNENLFTISGIKELSTVFNVSEQYLFRIFQTQLRISPHKYLILKRLLHAQGMLRQGKRPTEIYYLCGFESYVSFYKQYVKMFGYPPSKESSKY